jgi:hypothetical protein
VWVEDFKYHLAMALRAVGVGIAAVAWASVLASQAQQTGNFRSYAQVGAATLAALIVQLFAGLPPSATVAALLRPFERDIVAVAREDAGPDIELQQLYVARITALATVRIHQGANVPRDRRAWFRAISRLAQINER